MAVKKSTAPKSGTKTAKAKPAVKKAAPKKANDAKAKATPKAGAKKAAPKKAPGVKLTEPQKKFLESVAATKDEGVLGTKGTAKILGALLEKKLVKKGKKEGEHFRYHITKLGFEALPRAGQFDDELRAELGPAGLITASPGGMRAVSQQPPLAARFLARSHGVTGSSLPRYEPSLPVVR